MTPIGSILRVTVLTAFAGAVVGIATTTTSSVGLAGAHPSVGRPAVSTTAITDAMLVCPGPERVGASGLRDVKGETRVLAAVAPTSALRGITVAGPGTLAVGALGERPDQQSTDRNRSVSAAVSGGVGALVRATGSLAPGVVGVQTWLHRGDDDRGLAMAPCSTPASDLWLVGGDAGPSRTERLVLTNPGANTISVGFTVLGSKGTIDGAGHGISIPPRSRSVVSLDAIAPDVARPVVHVVATGGQVSGVLSDAWIDGATGRGIDDAAPSTPPGRDLVVPGIDKSGAASLRIGNPGDEEALVQIKVLTAKGVVQPDALRAVRVLGGSTADVPLDVPDGPIGVHLLADHAVVAGAWVERRVAAGTDRMGDFGWAPATAPVQRLAGLALPGGSLAGGAARLILTAGDAAAAVTVTTTGPDAQLRQVTVAAGHSSAIDLGEVDGVWVQPVKGSVHAAVSVSGVVDQVPVLSIVPLVETPLTAVTVPVRQVGN